MLPLAEQCNTGSVFASQGPRAFPHGCHTNAEPITSYHPEPSLASEEGLISSSPHYPSLAPISLIFSR